MTKLSERISSGEISREVVEAVAKAIFACNFHPDEMQEIIDCQWLAWPQDRKKAERQAGAAITALLRAIGE